MVNAILIVQMTQVLQSLCHIFSHDRIHKRAIQGTVFEAPFSIRGPEATSRPSGVARDGPGFCRGREEGPKVRRSDAMSCSTCLDGISETN